MDKKTSETGARGGEGVDPTPLRVGALTTIERVRKELAAVYRDARQGRIKPGEGTKLTYILRELATLIEQGETEARIAALESALEERRERR